MAKRWLANLLSLWSGAELAETSITLWQDMGHAMQHAYVLNGYDQMIQVLANNIPIQLSSEVTQIQNNKDNIVIVTRTHHRYVGKAAIITLPIGVLKTKTDLFHPPLPDRKRYAIEQIGFGLLDKAVLYFSECFWDSDVLSIQSLQDDANDLHPQVYVNYQRIMGKPILIAMIAGDTAKNLTKLSESAQHELLLRPLRRIYAKKFIAPTHIHLTHWADDPFSLGSYSYIARQAEEDYFKILAEPIDHKLFFAGEATHSDAYGTVHGAYESGIKAALASQ